MYHAIREEILCREERYVICDVLRKEEMEKNEVKKSGRGESAQYIILLKHWCSWSQLKELENTYSTLGCGE